MKTNISIITLAALIIGCNKVETKPVSVAIDSSTKMEITVTNAANVYDSTGIIHNLLLDSAISFTQREKSRDPSLLLDYLHEVYPTYCPKDAKDYFQKIDPAMLPRLYDDGQSVVRSLPFSAIEKDYLELILNTIKGNEDSSFAAYKDKISSIETKLLKEERLKEDSKRMLLSMTSIARHSGYYWLNSERFSNRTIVARGFFRWLLAATNSIISDVSTAAICYFAQLPYSYYPVACGVVSDLAYITIMGWY